MTGPDLTGPNLTGPNLPGESAPPALRAPALSGVRHGFFGRSGGVSTGIYTSLNAGSGSDDDPSAVAENRRRALSGLGDGTLVTVHQVHSADVVTLRAPLPLDARPRADAMVTDRPGLALGILTADCAPVLLSDLEAGVVGAAHAGWKGALGGVCQATVAAMEALGAAAGRITAAVGPCIARRSYEVDEGFVRRFVAADPAHERFFTPGRAGHHQFDLEGFVGAALAAAGVTSVTLMGRDTYSDPERFFSYRRACHASESDYGRQLSAIMI